MNEKELREIKRRFRPDKNNIPRIVGCFVNTAGNIIARISQPIGLTDSVAAQKLLTVMKKTLSGTLGTNLKSISYTTHQVTDGECHNLLMALNDGKLSDADTLEKLYARVIESIRLETNYVILLAADTYDVPSFSKDGEESDSGTVFNYTVCAVCPLKSLPEALTFRESDSLFHLLGESCILGAPELGCMFHAFDDRCTNIYGALYYTRSLSESYPDFMKNVLDSAPVMPPRAQKEAFSALISDSLSEDCSLELVRSVQNQVSEMVKEHKESRDPEPLTLTKATVKGVLENCGVAEEKLERLCEAFDESFGKNAELCPKNILPERKFELSMPEVSIKISPEYRNLVTTETVGDTKYVMIKVTGEVTVNGIAINLADN